MDEQYQILSSYLEQHHSTISRVEAEKHAHKIMSLTISQLGELLVDICDEVSRRIVSKEAFLAIRLEYSPKRNQARQKLADLSPSKFENLIFCAKQELERRFPELTQDGPCDTVDAVNPSNNLEQQFEQISQSIASLPLISGSAYQLCTVEEAVQASDSPSATTMLATPHSQHALSEPLPNLATSTEKEARSTVSEPLDDKAVEDCTARLKPLDFDTMEDLVAELDVLIGKEQNSEVAILKARHEQEVSVLRSHINHLEEYILPQKNQEISKLAAHIKDIEANLSALVKEHISCAQRQAEAEAAFSEQTLVLENIQSAYIQLQRQLAQSARTPKLETRPSLDPVFGKVPKYDIRLFGTIWTAYLDVQKSCSNIFELSDANLSEKLSKIKDSCVLAQKLIRAAEGLYGQQTKEQLSWLHDDLENLCQAKSRCLQVLSYAIVSCKDLVQGQVKTDREVRGALEQLTHGVRALVDAAELVISRAQVSPIQPIRQPQTTHIGIARFASAPNLSIEVADQEKNRSENSEDGRAQEQSLIPVAEEIRLKETLMEKLGFLLSTFQTLRNFVQNQKGKTFPIQIPSKVRANLSESLDCLLEIVNASKLLKSRPAFSKELAQIDDAQRKLQLIFINGAGVLADQSAQAEAINACSTIYQALQAFQTPLP